jgi:hypothetical protein
LYAKARANPAYRFYALYDKIYRKDVLLWAWNSQMTQRNWCWKETEELVGELNLVVRGWGNYFRLGSVSKAYRTVDGHVR